MELPTVTLRERLNTVKLQPSEDGTAVVVGGNVHYLKDRVSCPVAGMSWKEAAEEEVADGDTIMSPFDLQLEEDAITGFVLANFNDDSDPLDVEFPRSQSGSVEDDLYPEDADAYVRMVSGAINRPQARIHRRKKDSRSRRRRTDTAA